jgi:hypothetical protein
MWRDLVIGVDVVRKAMQQHGRPAVRGTGLLVGHIENAGMNVLEHGLGCL